MRKISLIALSLLTAVMVHAQKLTGVVKDQKGEPVIGAIVSIGTTYLKTITDKEGRYSFSQIDDGTYQVDVVMMGFKTKSSQVDIKGDTEANFTLEENVYVTDQLVIMATRAKDFDPITQQTIEKDELEQRNLGQDLPLLLNFTPSMVTTSDAGAGVGYTGMRIRGSNATRINVTVNGVPINDAESQGTFWVNMPDFASSTNSIQIQRGVGTSTNGAAAFGATVNMETTTLDSLPYGEISNSFGSFNTHKHTIRWGTGLINNKWTIDGRLSGIFSDGYIDRATSDLRSYYLSGGYHGKKTSVKILTFAGKERTYQSWWGTPEAILTGNTDLLLNHYYNNLGSIYNTPEDSINLFSSGRTYNYYRYQDEVDNYNQDHYQLHVNHRFNRNLTLNGALHYTIGRGYFEQFKFKEDISDYPITPFPGDTGNIASDIILRRWLDNDFYGALLNLAYTGSRYSIILGGAANQYKGDHFGEIIWAEYAGQSDIYDRYYDNSSEKNDANVFLKGSYKLRPDLALFADIQVRSVGYSAYGPDNDGRMIDVDTGFVFVNPKAGVTWLVNENQKIYGSFAVGNREPVRNDFVDAEPGQVPSHETLYDVELGYTLRRKKSIWNVNLYYMDYQNQLVLTGELNDVGSSIRRNVPDSYRAGIEFWTELRLFPKLTWNLNAAYSQNKIATFRETIYDYGTGEIIENTYTDTDIAFSPSVITGSQITYQPVTGLNVSLLTKYVGRQYLDNTSSDHRSLDAYMTQDILLQYSIKPKWTRELRFSLLVNNVLSEMYSSNGYTYSYIYGQTITENFYYPQAGINFLAGLDIRF